MRTTPREATRAVAHGPAPSTLRVVAPFLVVALVVLVLVGAALVLDRHDRATEDAVRAARSLTAMEARDVVGDHLDDASLTPGPAQRELDALVRAHVLGEAVVRVKVWRADGTIAYSDATNLIGQRFTLADDERAALLTGGTPVAEVTDLDEAENVDEQQFGRLLQVYVGVRTPEGTPLLFETYQPYDRIEAATARTLRSFLPTLLGGLLLLALLQAPLAWRMARRLRIAQEDREQLLLASLAASNAERRRIAADLHDGVVQGLSGTSLSLAVAAGRARAAGDLPAAEVMDWAATDLRRRIRELRSLVVTVTPPALHEQGLAVSLTDLAATLELRGMLVAVDVGGGLGAGEVSRAAESLVYRTAQEAVRNVVRHARAERARLTLRRDDDGLLLEVRDDGRGFDVSARTPRTRGSVGLELLTGLAAEQGGSLVVTSVPRAAAVDGAPSGTVVALRLPARAVLGEVAGVSW